MFNNKLNNYLFKEILKSYFLVLFSLSLLIWIAQAAKFLNLITESGLSINIYMSYIFLIYPKIASQLTIISFLLSLFLTFLKLLDNKELEIYWLSGISKIKIILITLRVSIIPTLISLILYLYLVPSTNAKSRQIIANSEFSMVNSLVKKNNFNSPLQNLTIFVNKNDNQGNIEKVYIFEKFKTIISKKGRVINIQNKNYLELTEGFIHEKDSNGNISVVKFEKTIFDFTKYQTGVIKYPKQQERSTLWLIKNFKKNKNSDILYEIHKRLIKPFFIPAIAILCCFLLYTNNEKINLLKLKIFIFSISSFFIIFLEVILNLSVKNLIFQLFFYLMPFLLTLILFQILKKFLEKEPVHK
jgi:lipopolysaccharide export system permease protein